MAPQRRHHHRVRPQDRVLPQPTHSRPAYASDVQQTLTWEDPTAPFRSDPILHQFDRQWQYETWVNYRTLFVLGYSGTQQNTGSYSYRGYSYHADTSYGYAYDPGYAHEEGEAQGGGVGVWG